MELSRNWWKRRLRRLSGSEPWKKLHRTKHPWSQPPYSPRSLPDLQINSSSGDPFELALFYHQSGDYLRALEDYNEMLDQNPMNKSVHNNLGLMYMSMANNPEAIRSFNTAIPLCQHD